MSSRAAATTTDIKVVGAKKLQNSSIVYELNNLSPAQWYARKRLNS